MKLSISLAAAMVYTCCAAAQAAPVVLMSPTVNDGSFEEAGGTFSNGINVSPSNTYWTVSTAGTGLGGELDRNVHNVVLADASGRYALFADQPSVTTALSRNLLGGGYTSITVGDAFEWSFRINAYTNAGVGEMFLDFGNGREVSIARRDTADSNIALFTTYSGTYYATAADAGSTQVRVKFRLESNTTNAYADDIRLTANGGVPTPGTLPLVALLLPLLGAFRQRQR